MVVPHKFILVGQETILFDQFVSKIAGYTDTEV